MDALLVLRLICCQGVSHLYGRHIALISWSQTCILNVTAYIYEVLLLLTVQGTTMDALVPLYCTLVRSLHGHSFLVPYTYA